MREIEREKERERGSEREREGVRERQRESERETERERAHWSVFLHISPVIYFTAACEHKLNEKTVFHGDSLFIDIVYLWVDLSPLTRQELNRQCQYWERCECM